jgi:hypothetical protein
VIDLADVLRANPGKSPWAAWLAKREHFGAQDILVFLEVGLGRLSMPDQRRVADRLRSDVAENVDAVLYQLTAFEMCHRLKLRPEYEPKYGAKTPDLRIKIGGRPFAAEAFRCARPQSTLVPGGNEDAGETARKIRQGIEAKASKYKSLPDPLVVLALYAGNDIVHQDLEDALFGSNGLPEQVSLERDCHESWQVCGVMCPQVPRCRRKRAGPTRKRRHRPRLVRQSEQETARSTIASHRFSPLAAYRFCGSGRVRAVRSGAVAPGGCSVVA